MNKEVYFTKDSELITIKRALAMMDFELEFDGYWVIIYKDDEGNQVVLSRK